VANREPHYWHHTPLGENGDALEYSVGQLTSQMDAAPLSRFVAEGGLLETMLDETS